MRQIFSNIFEQSGKLYLPSEKTVFSERLERIDGKTYREWDARRSKLAAAIAKGAKISIEQTSKMLYLGAAHGYTISFISEILAQGKIYAVEFAPRVARELIMLAEKRKNILPIVADANQPNSYYHILEPVDIVFQDIAQRNQVEIFEKNCRLFLKKGGVAMLALKARSIDASEQPQKIFTDVKEELSREFKILDYRNLNPLQKDHAFFICEKR